jgi:hypothetical protein
MDRIFVDSRWHSRLLDIPSFRGADCDTDHCLVAAGVRERLSVSKKEKYRSLIGTDSVSRGTV